MPGSQPLQRLPEESPPSLVLVETQGVLVQQRAEASDACVFPGRAVLRCAASVILGWLQ